MEKETEIVAVTAHQSVLVTGQVRGHISAIGSSTKLTFDGPGDLGYDGTSRGIWIRGKATCKLVPYGNLKCIDVQEKNGEQIVVAMK